MVGCGGGAFWWILGERASKLTIICPLGIRMRGPAMVVPSETPQSRRSRLRLPDLRAEAVAGIRTAFFGSRPSRSGRTTSCRLLAPSHSRRWPNGCSTDRSALTRLRARSVERRVIARPTCRPSRDTPARSDRVAGSWITEPRTRATKSASRQFLGRVSVERAIGGGQGDGGSGGSDSTRTNRTR